MKIFKEEQKFTQLFAVIIHTLNLGILALMTYAVIQQIILGKPFGDKPAPDVVLILLFILVLAITLFLFSIKLKTRIDETGIHYQFFLYHRSFKTIPWKDVNRVYVRKYSPITEYGGWGLKGSFFTGSNRAVNISGNIGIQIEFKDGTRTLVGTQKETEAKQVLETYKSKIQ